MSETSGTTLVCVTDTNTNTLTAKTTTVTAVTIINIGRRDRAPRSGFAT